MPNAKILLVGFLTSLFLLQISVIDAQAVVAACATSADPTTVYVSVGTFSINFFIHNTDSVNFNWIKITAPSTNFTVTSGDRTGWSTAVSGNAVTFSGGTLSNGTGGYYTVSGTLGSSTAAAASWNVQVSDDSGGASPFSCTGNSSITIENTPPDTTPPQLSDPTVSDVAATSVKINWTSDESATSIVYYGATDSYGSNKADSALVTTHAVVLTGLNPNTTYHYTYKSTDAAGNVGDTSDNTFVTAQITASPAPQVVVASPPPPSPSPHTTPVPSPIPDTIPPHIEFSTDFSKPTAVAPAISGLATDDRELAQIDYSTDGGNNWTPVDISPKKTTTKETFTFTPRLGEDGNYKIIARVRDSSGNLGFTPAMTLIIDRLPPQVGSSVISFGSQILLPQENGLLITAIRLDQKITLSAIGGPITIDLLARLVSPTNSENPLQVFSLTKNPDTGLWSGTLSFSKAGLYELSARAVDGADNRRVRVLNWVLVEKSGTVSYHSAAIKTAQVTAYYFEPHLKQFVIWDGVQFGQRNPQRVDGSGNYQQFMPAGTYYITVTAPGFKTSKTNIFTLESNTIINSDLTLVPLDILRIGPINIPIPDFISTSPQIQLQINPPKMPDLMPKIASLIDQEFPDTFLTSVTGPVASLTFRGTPTVITLLSSWLPQTSEQLMILDQLSAHKEIAVVPIFIQEPLSTTIIYQKRGGYGLTMYADPDGNLVEPLNVQMLPAHFFVSSSGIIKNIKIGMLTSSQLLDTIQGIIKYK